MPQENIWIQRRSYRLGTGSERREIQSARLFSNQKKGGRRLTWL